VAIALEHGAGRVAVEIDPRLQQLGVELQPQRPDQDPRVEAHIDDGRAFLQRTDRRYDLVLFALPDSLTLVSGQSQLRLGSFLFTREALAEARDHLKPGGVFTMYNYYPVPVAA
jgi:spermidine synthase